MKDRSNRIQFLDVMRGFAVVVMVMGHSIDSVLSTDVRSSDVFRLYDAVRGFTGPIFLFVSGYAFTGATEKRWAVFTRLGAPAVKRLLKVLLLLLVGYALHVPFFSFEKLLHNTTPGEYAQFFQADVLHCVAVSLLVLQALVLISGTPRRLAISSAVLGSVIVVATPLMWMVDFSALLSPAIAPYLSARALSIFPIFPFSAFLFAGAVAGHFYLQARSLHAEKEFFVRLLACSGVLVAAGLIFDLVPVHLYPSHDYWKASPNFFAVRLGIVLLITVCFFVLREIPSWLASIVVRLGQASLVIYVTHLLIVYGSAANNGLMQIVGQRLPFPYAVGVGMGVLGLMIAFVQVREFLRSNFSMAARFVQAAAASMVLLEFFRRPW